MKIPKTPFMECHTLLRVSRTLCSKLALILALVTSPSMVLAQKTVGNQNTTQSFIPTSIFNFNLLDGEKFDSYSDMFRNESELVFVGDLNGDGLPNYARVESGYRSLEFSYSENMVTLIKVYDTNQNGVISDSSKIIVVDPQRDVRFVGDLNGDGAYEAIATTFNEYQKVLSFSYVNGEYEIHEHDLELPRFIGSSLFYIQSERSYGDLDGDGFDDVLVGPHYPSLSESPFFIKGSSDLANIAVIEMEFDQTILRVSDRYKQHLVAGNVDNDDELEVVLIRPQESMPSPVIGIFNIRELELDTLSIGTLGISIGMDPKFRLADVSGDGFDDLLMLSTRMDIQELNIFVWNNQDSKFDAMPVVSLENVHDFEIVDSNGQRQIATLSQDSFR